MRSRVPIVITDRLHLNAAYVGWWNPKILVARDATKILSEEDLRALISHEEAHRNCFHVEINFLLSAIIFYAVITALVASPFWGVVEAAILSVLMRLVRLMQEAEADAYADPECMERVILMLSRRLGFEERYRLRILRAR